MGDGEILHPREGYLLEGIGRRNSRTDLSGNSKNKDL